MSFLKRMVPHRGLLEQIPKQAPNIIALGLVVVLPLALYMNSKDETLTYQLTPLYQYDLFKKKKEQSGLAKKKD
jgi:hypothetical protein